MKKFLAIWFIVVSGLTNGWTNAQEKITLTTPIAQPTISEFEIQGISLTRLPQWSLIIYYKDNFGRDLSDSHIGIVSASNPGGADVLVKSLNTANLSVQSLERRALLHLQSEGKIPAGSIVGSPQ